MASQTEALLSLLNEMNAKISSMQRDMDAMKQTIAMFTDAGYYYDSLSDKITIFKLAKYQGSGADHSTPWYPWKEKINCVEFKDSVTSIGDFLFCHCNNLKSIIIPTSVTYIGVGTFKDCHKLHSVYIPASVTKMGCLSSGTAIFSNCSSLKEIVVDNFNKNFVSEDGVLFTKDKTTLINYPAGKQSKEYTIPSSVTHICWNAFNGACSLLSVKFESNKITEIPWWSFGLCPNLTSITLPDSVTTIGEGAFNGCSSLKSISIPKSVQLISNSAFCSCPKLSSITVPKNCECMDSFDKGPKVQLKNFNPFIFTTNID